MNNNFLQNISKWLFFGVILSLLPIGIPYFDSFITGYAIDKDTVLAEYLPDYILTAFAIGVNVFGTLENKAIKKKFPKIKVFLILVAVTLFCFFYTYHSLITKRNEKINTVNFPIMFNITVVITMVYVISIIIIYFILYKNPKKAVKL